MSETLDTHTHIGVDIGGGYSQTLEELLSKMEKGGIDKAVVCSFPSPGQDIAKSNNELTRMQGKRIVSFGTIYPRSEDAPSEIERCVGKLDMKGLMIDVEASNLYMTTWFPLAEVPVIQASFRAVERAHVPLLIHMRNPFSVWNASGLAHFIDRMAKRYPNLIIITNTLLPAVSLALRNKNVYVETEYSGQPVDFERYLYMAGPKRILFASNSPIEHPYVMRKMVEKSHLTEKQKSLVLSENPRRVINF